MEEDIVPPVSPSDTNPPEEVVTPPEGTDNQPGKKSAEARINELIAEVKTLQDKVNEREVKMAPPPPPPVNKPTSEMTPEVAQAAAFLKELGFIDQAELSKRDKLMEERLQLNAIHSSLSSQYSGADGRPKYEAGKVEDYMRKRAIYDPEAAYKLMHEEELLDWSMKQKSQPKPASTAIRPGSSQPGGAGGNQTITREDIAEWLKTPAGRAKYEKNRAKIFDLMSKGLL